MRIVIWNCNMALHRKYEELLSLKPDIAVIPECANPELLAKNAPQFKPNSMVWVGANPHKGLGIFAFNTFGALELPIHQAEIPYIVPVRVIGPTPFNLLGVWACHTKLQPWWAKKGPLNRGIEVYHEFLEEGPSVVGGTSTTM